MKLEYMNCIVGHAWLKKAGADDEHLAVYSHKKLLDALQKDGLSVEEAILWIEDKVTYNSNFIVLEEAS